MLSRPGAAAEHAMRNATNLETESMMMGRRKPILIDLKGAKPLPCRFAQERAGAKPRAVEARSARVIEASFLRSVNGGWQVKC